VAKKYSIYSFLFHKKITKIKSSLHESLDVPRNGFQGTLNDLLPIDLNALRRIEANRGE